VQTAEKQRRKKSPQNADVVLNITFLHKQHTKYHGAWESREVWAVEIPDLRFFPIKVINYLYKRGSSK